MSLGYYYPGDVGNSAMMGGFSLVASSQHPAARSTSNQILLQSVKMDMKLRSTIFEAWNKAALGAIAQWQTLGLGLPNGQIG